MRIRRLVLVILFALGAGVHVAPDGRAAEIELPTLSAGAQVMGHGSTVLEGLIGEVPLALMSHGSTELRLGFLGPIHSIVLTVPPAGPEPGRFATVVPHPVRGRCVLHFVLPAAEPLRLVVFDVHGREVARLHDGWAAAGPHRIPWDARSREGRELAAGIYFAVIEAAGRRVTHRLVLLR